MDFLEGALRIEIETNKKGETKRKIAPFRPSPANVSAVIDALQAISQLDEHIDPPTWIDTNDDMPPADELFACANGLLHLPSGEIHDPRPNFFNLNASEVVYDPTAEAPQWLAFLTQLFGNDTQAVELLQDWFGYVMSPDTSQQKIVGIIGPIRSGKGTLARVLKRLLGSSAVAGPTMHSLGEHFGLEPLITKSLAIISDVRIGSHPISRRSPSACCQFQEKMTRRWHASLSKRGTVI